MFDVIQKTLFFCVFSTPLFGQSDSLKVSTIDDYVRQINPLQKKVDSFTFTIDSIQIDGLKYEYTIVVKSLFQKSKTILTTTFYLKDAKMIFAKVVEPSRGKGSEKMYRYCDFYLENSKVIFERCRATRQVGVAININDNNATIYGYNESLTFDFLKNYVAILYNRLQNYR